MFCNNCKKQIRVALKNFDEQLSHALNIAYDITKEISGAIQNPLFQISVSMLPGGSDVKKIIEILSKELPETVKAIEDCKELDGMEKLTCLAHKLNFLPENERNSVLLRLSSALAAHIDGKRYDRVVYDTAAQANYLNEKLKNEKYRIKTSEQEKRPVNDTEQIPVDNLSAVIPAIIENPVSEETETQQQPDAYFQPKPF